MFTHSLRLSMTTDQKPMVESTIRTCLKLEYVSYEKRKQEEGMHMWFLGSPLTSRLLMSNGWLTTKLFNKGDPDPHVPYKRVRPKCCTGPQRTKRSCLHHGVPVYTGQSGRSSVLQLVNFKSIDAYRGDLMIMIFQCKLASI